MTIQSHQRLLAGGAAEESRAPGSGSIYGIEVAHPFSPVD